MKKILPFFILTILFPTAGVGQVSFVHVKPEILNPKHYIICKTSKELVIDGLADESAWQQAKFSDKFIDIEGIKQPKYYTRMKMLWDDQYLYVYAELQEPHIWADIEKRDAIIYYNNDFEVFIDPSSSAQNYGEIEINALNTVWDLYLNKAYRVGGSANFNWNLDKLQSAVKIYGSINNPNDIDSLWTVEMAIPMKPLLRLKNKPRTIPKEGEQWRMNFSRVEWDFSVQKGTYGRKKIEGNYLPEYNWVWSNQNVINMHEPEKWGYVQFTYAASSENIEYEKEPDLELKQVIYALFRQTKGGKQKRLLKHDRGYEEDLIVQYSFSQSIKATFHRTHFGFEFELKSPITNITYFINEEGVLKSKP